MRKRRILEKLCECGCGNAVTWNKKYKRWNYRLIGHHERTPEMMKALGTKLKNGASSFHAYNKTKAHSEKVSASNRRRKLSDATKQKISESLTGHTRSEESILKQRITTIDNNSRRKENHHLWKGGISAYDDVGEWQKLRHEIKKRDNYTCQKCGNTNRKLAVHHIDFTRHNHAPPNLITLCDPCHKDKHTAHGDYKTRKK